jgi:hypothetical protein
MDKRIGYTDDGIEMYYITYRVEQGINQGLLKDIRCSGRVYYSCEVGKKYHVLIQSNGVWKSWHEIDY